MRRQNYLHSFNMGKFAYLRGGLTCPYNPTEQLSPLWSGAAGGRAPSTLDDGQVGPVVAQREAARLLMVEEEDRTASEFNLIASSQDESNVRFLEDFRMVQEYSDQSRQDAIYERSRKKKAFLRRKAGLMRGPDDDMPPVPED